MPINAAEILRRSASEPERFADFYDVFFRELLSYLTRRTGDAETGFDLTSETFAQAYVSRSRFRGCCHAEAAAWIYTIAKRQLSAYERTGRARRRALEQLGIEHRQVDDRAAEEIEQIAQLDELRATLRPRLADLTQERREALGLRVIEDRPFAEIAEILGVSEEAARARVSRALRQLSEGLDEQFTAKEALT